MPESLEDHRRLLVSEEDGSVFLLIMGTGLIERTWTLGSWDYPANVDLENPWHPLPADAVHGDSKEVHLDICIIKLNVDH